MKNWNYAACVLIMFFGAVEANAGDIYICKGTHGENVYQNAPCAKSSNQLEHRKYDASMARAADGSTGATERVYTAPRSASGSYAGNGGVASANAPINYSSRDMPSAPMQRVTAGGIGSSAYQRGEVRGRRCVTPKGRVYYTAGECSTSVTYAGTAPVDWRKDQVQGMPGAVMTGPNEAMNPMTGRLVQLDGAPSVAPVYRRTRDAGTPMDANAACAGARKVAAGRFDRRADQRVQDLCRSGRSLYDQQRSPRP